MSAMMMGQIRKFALACAGLVATGGAFAQTWDLDACVMWTGPTLASPTNPCVQGGSTVSVSGYYSTGSTTAFAPGTLNTGGTAPGGWTGVRSRNTAGQLEESGSTYGWNHAIDNIKSTTNTNGTTLMGASYEVVKLDFTQAVDLSKIVAASVVGGLGTGDFQLWRWNDGTSAPDADLSSYNPTGMTGWTAVTTRKAGTTTSSSDFGDGLSKDIFDATYYSSYWLVSTNLTTGANFNDAFKLGSVTAAAVCGAGNSVNGSGACNPDQTQNVPEPASLALFFIAALGAKVARRRSRAMAA